MGRTCRAGLMLLAALVTMAGEAAAQRRDGMLEGRVVDDSTGAALAGARVELLSEDRHVLRTTTADAGGAFAFAIRSTGGYRLRAGRVGFRDAVTPPLRLAKEDSVAVEVRLRTGSVLLAPLTVVARPVRLHRAPELAAFRERLSQRVAGRFITRQDVQARRPFRLTDMLSQAGVGVTGRAVAFNRRPACSPVVYVDGLLMRAASAYDAVNLVAPGDVEGIEMYAGMSTVPPEFLGQVPRCGVIAIWTRRGEAGG